MPAKDARSKRTKAFRRNTKYKKTEDEKNELLENIKSKLIIIKRERQRIYE